MHIDHLSLGQWRPLWPLLLLISSSINATQAPPAELQKILPAPTEPHPWQKAYAQSKVAMTQSAYPQALACAINALESIFQHPYSPGDQDHYRQYIKVYTQIGQILYYLGHSPPDNTYNKKQYHKCAYQWHGYALQLAGYIHASHYRKGELSMAWGDMLQEIGEVKNALTHYQKAIKECKKKGKKHHRPQLYALWVRCLHKQGDLHSGYGETMKQQAQPPMINDADNPPTQQ